MKHIFAIETILLIMIVFIFIRGENSLHNHRNAPSLLNFAMNAVAQPYFGGSEYQWLTNSEIVFFQESVNSTVSEPEFYRKNLYTGELKYDIKMSQTLSGVGDWEVVDAKNHSWVFCRLSRLPSRNKKLSSNILYRIEDGRIFNGEMSKGKGERIWFSDDKHYVDFISNQRGSISKWGNLYSKVTINSLNIADTEGKEPTCKITLSKNSICIT